MFAFLLPRIIAASWAIMFALQIDGFGVAQDATLNQRPELLGTIKESDVTESSGLAISRATPDAFWTHNDSGHKPDLFLLSTKGKTLAKCKLKKARNVDWEAMSSFQHDEKPWLMVADVGDNSLNRAKPKIYLLPEPTLSNKKKKKKSGQKLESDVSAIEFTYPDGAHNVEAAAVSPDGMSVWLIEKIHSNDLRPIQPGIYRLPLDASDFDLKADERPKTDERAPRSAVRLADYPIRNVTGMSFSPDGRRLIVRNYLNAHFYTRDEGKTWAETVAGTKPTPIVLPLQSQGEAICFTADSKSVLITSEFKRSTIWKVDLPAE